MKTQKLALITGASSGIGEATAFRFAAGGWKLLLTARRNEKLESFKQLLETRFHIEVEIFQQDVRDQQSSQQLAKFMTDNALQPDLLVNNAGLAVGIGPFQDGNIDDWERMIDTNIKGLLYVSRAIAPIMIKQGFGHIINIGSIAGKEAYPGGNVYCATKHAVDGLTKSMRMDLLGDGIRVSQIAPGAVETEFSVVRFKGDAERAKNVYQGFEPLKAEDIADAIWYVANVPPHVNINDLLIMPTAQASATQINRQTNK